MGLVAGLAPVRKIWELNARVVLIIVVVVIEDVVLIAFEDLNAGLRVTHRVVGTAAAVTHGPKVEEES